MRTCARRLNRGAGVTCDAEDRRRTPDAQFAAGGGSRAIKENTALLEKENLRPTWLEIDLPSVAANVALLKARLAPATGLMAVVKANAYGHGAVEVSQTALAAGATSLGVALPEEGATLRRAGIGAPILVLGPASPDQAAVVSAASLTQTVYSHASLEAMSKEGVAGGRPVAIQVKVDTGMGRLGVRPDQALAFLRRVAHDPGVRLEGVFTHLARADEPDPAPTRRQLAILERLRRETARAGIPVPVWHAANSAAAWRFPESHLDLVRVGIAVYGLDPFPGFSGDLRPALTWKTKIAFLKEVEAGTPLSYGALYHTPDRARIATLPVGYADGYARSLTNTGLVLVGGRRVPVVGRVCMDQLLVDVTAVRDVREGDEAVLLGNQGDERITASEMAGWRGTVNYEVVCAISSRVPRTYRKR